jgi:hypothetical protein
MAEIAIQLGAMILAVLDQPSVEGNCLVAAIFDNRC